MSDSDLLARIAPEPGKMGGKPVIRGRRVTPSMVLTMLARVRAAMPYSRPILFSKRRISMPASSMPRG